MVSVVISARVQRWALERVLVSMRLERITSGARDVRPSAPREVVVREGGWPAAAGESRSAGGPGVGGGQCRFGALIGTSRLFGVIFSEGEVTQVR